MRHTTAAALVVAAVLAGAAPAGAKGMAAASVCGASGCRRVDRGAVRAGFEAFTPAPAPRRAEPFYTIRMRAHVSSGRIVEVYSLDWLPRAGRTRGYGERAWMRPGGALTAALREAADGLRPHPAAELGDVADAPPTARVVEVFTPLERGGDRSGVATGVAAGGLLALAAAPVRRARRRRAPPVPRTG